MYREHILKSGALEAALAIKIAIDIDPFKRNSIPAGTNSIPIGRNMLQIAFKHTTGMTIKRYRLQKRMEVARDLLLNSRFNVKQVAFHCGYRNQSNFTEDYKKIFSVSPSDWRRSGIDR